MNIHPSAATASAAGTAHAASKGGESDSQANEATARQKVREAPAGKRAEASAVEGGERMGDRGGDGRQLYDTFEHAGEEEQDEGEQQCANPQERGEAPPQPGSGSRLDLQA